MKLAKGNGLEIWQGPSRIDGGPIVVLCTGVRRASRNTKTGTMYQTWVLRADVPPILATRIGADGSVCGDCKHRPTLGDEGTFSEGSCYVNLRAPQAIWKAWRRGSYGRGMPTVGVAQSARLGAYGDPAAVPIRVWDGVLRGVDSWTGYTHQWRRFPSYRRLLMASVDTDDELQLADSKGWRCFHVRPKGASLPTGLGRPVIDCPAPTRGVKCKDCLLCRGVACPRSPHISIEVHGSAPKLSAYRRLSSLWPK